MAEPHDTTLSTTGDFRIRRRLRASTLDTAQLEALRALPGMLEVSRDGEHLQLHYDRSRIGFADIERAGLKPAGGRLNRLRYALWRYLDENARANAGERGGNCCSNPVDVYSRRQRR